MAYVPLFRIFFCEGAAKWASKFMHHCAKNADGNSGCCVASVANAAWHDACMPLVCERTYGRVLPHATLSAGPVRLLPAYAACGGCASLLCARDRNCKTTSSTLPPCPSLSYIIISSGCTYGRYTVTPYCSNKRTLRHSGFPGDHSTQY